MKKLYVIYLADDVYELPCAVFTCTRDVADWLGVSQRAVQLHAAGKTQRIGRVYKIDIINRNTVRHNA